MPKGRYALMKKYMPTVGTMGLDMMFRTCTVQVRESGGDPNHIKTLWTPWDLFGHDTRAWCMVQVCGLQFSVWKAAET